MSERRGLRKWWAALVLIALSWVALALLAWCAVRVLVHFSGDGVVWLDLGYFLHRAAWQ